MKFLDKRKKKKKNWKQNEKKIYEQTFSVDFRWLK